MIKERFALFYDIKAKKLTIFKYCNDIVNDIVFYRQEQISIKSNNGQREIDFYIFYYDIPKENIIIM